MSSPTEHEQSPFCPNFSAGRWCRQKRCSLIHKWALFKAARKEEKKRAGKPLKEFTIFSRLPFQIRLVIWKIALGFNYDPTVVLRAVYDTTGAIAFRDLVCRSPTPIVLRINHESRTEALKHYHLTLGNTTYLHEPTGLVFLDGEDSDDLTHFVASVPLHEIQKIENLAVKEHVWSWTDENFGLAVQQFSNLKTLVMIRANPNHNVYIRKRNYLAIWQALQPATN